MWVGLYYNETGKLLLCLETTIRGYISCISDCRLLPIGDVHKLLALLVAELDPSYEDEMIETGMSYIMMYIIIPPSYTYIAADVQDSETQLAMSQLFASPVSERLLADIVGRRCLARLMVTTDLLLLISLLQHQGKVAK